MARLLYVEDEEEILRTVKKLFIREGFDVYAARSAPEALELAERHPPDVAVLDVMLQEGPDGSTQTGYDICKALRDRKFRGPVIFLTARTSEQDKLIGFELGADD